MNSQILDDHAARFVAPLSPCLGEDSDTLTARRIQRVKELAHLIRSEFETRLVVNPETIYILVNHLAVMVEDLVENSYPAHPEFGIGDWTITKLYRDVVKPYTTFVYALSMLGFTGIEDIRVMITKNREQKEWDAWYTVAKMLEKNIEDFKFRHISWAVSAHNALHSTCLVLFRENSSDSISRFRREIQTEIIERSEAIICDYVAESEKVRGTEADLSKNHSTRDPTGRIDDSMYAKCLEITAALAFSPKPIGDVLQKKRARNAAVE